MDEIVFNQEKNIGLATLNRVSALNALTLPMIIAYQQQLQLWENDPAIHGIILQAAPGKAFCAGGDVRWLYETGRANNSQQMEFFWHEYRLNHFIHKLKKPYIALMDGITMGGGVGISLHGSHSVASEKFVFAMPETSIGFFPDIGASYLLARCPDNVGIYLGLTGNRLGPDDALALGLVKFYVPAAQQDLILNQLINTDLSTGAHEKVTQCLQQLSAPQKAAPIFDKKAAINEVFRHRKIETIIKNLQEHSDEFHQEIVQNLKQKAPLSLKVTLAQIQRAQEKSLAECLQTDYCLVQHFVKDNDFYEGIRALLVDKDKNPHWLPQTLAEIGDGEVERRFKSEVQQRY